MAAERLNPLSSVMFSCIFRDMESKFAMLEILNAILAEVGEEPVEEILDIKSAALIFLISWHGQITMNLSSLSA